MVQASKATAVALVTLLITGCTSQQACKPGEAVYRSFAYQLKTAVDKKKLYPSEAVREGLQGKVKLGFDYTDGYKASNIQVIQSSGSSVLDSAAAVSLSNADLPPKPCGMEDVKHFTIVEAFGLD